MPDKKIYTAKRIFTGDRWLDDHAIVIQDGITREIVPRDVVAQVTGGFDTLLPAFIDLQLYGAYGKLISVYPEAETISLIHHYCMEGGAYWFQPTVATNTKEVIFACIDAVREYRGQGGEGCLGLHVEGPWISREKRGAHIESLVHAPMIDEVKELLDYGKGIISMITLAPEVCSDEVIRTILAEKVILSAGHSNTSYKNAIDAFGKGITTVTHLYNAMSGLQHREPGLVGASLLHPQVMASIIPDGHHVDYPAIRIAKQVMGDRLFLITDAVTDTDSGAYPHQKEGDKYVAGGILSGSALTMMQGVKNMIEHVGTDASEAIRMACVYPAKAAQLDHKIGKIAAGFTAKFIATDERLERVSIV